MRRVQLTLHVVGLPHTDFSGNFPACAFTNEIVRFVEMMTIFGYKVHVYGAGEHHCPRSGRTVSCLSASEMAACLDGKHYTAASFDPTKPHWQKFNKNVISSLNVALLGAKPEEHIICLYGGRAHKEIADAFPRFISCEPGVGYEGSFAKYRVFRSYAWMHATYGLKGGSNWMDAVIPGFLPDRAWQPFNGLRVMDPDYLLFVGRLNAGKGVHIAEQIAKKAGLPLAVIGEGPLKRETEPGVVHFFGELAHDERDAMMAYSRAVLMPSTYFEPFGYVAVEAMAQGTPVITPDWGAFPETVINGVSGWRCHNMREFCEAVEAAKYIDRDAVRSYALGNFSLQAVGPQYDAYFRRLADTYTDGWYA